MEANTALRALTTAWRSNHGVPWWQAARRRSHGGGISEENNVNHPTSIRIFGQAQLLRVQSEDPEERRLRQCGRDTSLVWSEYPFRVEGTRVDDTVLYTVEDSRMER